MAQFVLIKDEVSRRLINIDQIVTIVFTICEEIETHCALTMITGEVLRLSVENGKKIKQHIEECGYVLKDTYDG